MGGFVGWGEQREPQQTASSYSLGFAVLTPTYLHLRNGRGSIVVIEKIISGGQTGVDRAALDVALELGMNCGGWCPRGRRAEDGTLDPRYPLTETPVDRYAQRTEWNVRDSDATLILNRGLLEGGTLRTFEIARALDRPVRAVDLDRPDNIGELILWLEKKGVKVLNIAGPRESGRPGIQETAARYLRRLLAVTRD